MKVLIGDKSRLAVADHDRVAAPEGGARPIAVLGIDSANSSVRPFALHGAHFAFAVRRRRNAVTKTDLARRRGLLVWEAACEQLNDALQSAPARPPLTLEQIDEAIRLARKALDELEDAFYT
ncbi:hypothetical protein LJR290_000167 [Variovorax sp. LjRoot290]|uniref:hypothetical protein n=1 Tax=unclassified Variovorax TaxID=663243 RepID=UPI003ED14990